MLQLVRRAVEMYLTLIWGEGKDESDRIVSDICGVDKTLVMRARDELVQNTSSLKPPSHRLGKDGKMHPATKRKTDTKDDTAPEHAPVWDPIPGSPSADAGTEGCSLRRSASPRRRTTPRQSPPQSRNRLPRITRRSAQPRRHRA